MYNHRKNSCTAKKRTMHYKKRLFILLTALILSILAYAASALFVPSKEAYAHSFVIGSDPVDGSTIDAVPAAVRIYFNAPISKLSSVQIIAIGNGNETEVNAAPASIAPGNPQELVTSIKTPQAQPQGSYEVKWTAIDTNDGHPTYGIIGFNVGFSSTGLSGTTTLGPATSNDLTAIRTLDAQGALSVLWAWITLIALTLWIGVLALERLLTTGGRTLLLLERVQKQTISLQWLCLGALLVSDCVNMFLRISSISKVLHLNAISVSTFVHLVSETNYGHLWVIRIALILCAMLLLALNKPQPVPPAAPETTQKKINSGATGPLRQYVTGELRTITTASLPKELTTTRDLASKERAANTTKERPAKDTKEKITKEVAPTQPNTGQRYSWLMLPIAGIFLLTQVFTGSDTQVMEPHVSAILFTWLNLGASALWFGGLAYLCYTLLPGLVAAERDHHTEILSALLRRLTPYIMAATAIVVCTQIFLGEATIGNPGAFLSDMYGRTLLVQCALIVILLLLSLYALFVLRPRLSSLASLLPVVNLELPARRKRQSALDQSRQKFRIITGAQAWLGIGVLLCSALMSFFAPPIVFPNVNYGTQTSTGGQTAAQTQKLGNLTATVLIAPGTIHTQNTVVLTLNRADGTPVTDAQVQITANMQAMDMGSSQATMKYGNATYTATFDNGKTFSMAGLWIIDVNVQEPGQQPLHSLFKIMLN